jgi:hypothetical protein
MHKKSHSADSVESLETRNAISNEVINILLQSCFKLQWQPRYKGFRCLPNIITFTIVTTSVAFVHIILHY